MDLELRGYWLELLEPPRNMNRESAENWADVEEIRGGREEGREGDREDGWMDGSGPWYHQLNP